MNIEELSKSQLILLTILVNFVTSVATGILTVSLLDHAPPVVSQTVNRIVDHTIETVAAPAAVIAAPTPTPAPSTQDLVTAALAADQARFAYVYDGKTGTSSPAIAIGTYLVKSRAVATASLASLPKEALVVFADGSSAPASLSHEGGGISIYGFGDKAALPSAPAVSLVPAGALKLGQTALAVGSDGGASTGIVSQVVKDGVHTTLPDIGAGSATVDLSGNLIGIAAGGTAGLLIGTDQILALLTATTTASAATTTAPHS